jgi:hypothetical protein
MVDFISAMAPRRELKIWPMRYTRLAVVVYPVACQAVLLAVPVIARIAHRTGFMRWAASLLGARFVTAIMLQVMQLSIILG